MTASEQSIMQGIMRKHGYGKYRRYTAADIKRLNPQDHIRRRPEMYFGGRDKQALQWLYETILDDVVESCFSGQCSELTLKIQDDNYLIFDYNDQIISKDMVYKHPSGKHTLDLVLTEIGIGRTQTYEVSGGLHGVGLSAVPPVCTQFEAEVCHQGQIWKRTYYEGYARHPMQIYKLNTPRPDGVMFRFQPDFTVFEPNDFDYDWIARRCQEIAYLMPAMTIRLIDEREGQAQQDIFHYPDGIQAMVHDLTQGYTSRHNILYKHEVVTLADRNNHPYEVIVEVALQYTDAEASTVRGYVNSVLSENGGTHVDALRHALMGYINGANPHPHSWENISQGLTAIIHIWHPDPQYESMQDVKLLNPDVFDAVESLLYPLFTEHNLRKLRQENKDS